MEQQVCIGIEFVLWLIFIIAESHGDYVGLNGQIIQFNTGDTSHTHTIIITQDYFCEIDPNEYFFSNIVLVSGVQPIQVALPQANVTIDASLGPECGKIIKRYN